MDAAGCDVGPKVGTKGVSRWDRGLNAAFFPARVAGIPVIVQVHSVVSNENFGVSGEFQVQFQVQVLFNCVFFGLKCRWSKQTRWSPPRKNTRRGLPVKVTSKSPLRAGAPQLNLKRVTTPQIKKSLANSKVEVKHKPELSEAEWEAIRQMRKNAVIVADLREKTVTASKTQSPADLDAEEAAFAGVFNNSLGSSKVVTTHGRKRKRSSGGYSCGHAEMQSFIRDVERSQRIGERAYPSEHLYECERLLGDYRKWRDPDDPSTQSKTVSDPVR